MKKVLLYIGCTISLISIFLTIMCGEVPTNPFKDPNNVKATFTILNNSSGINYQDQAVDLGIIIKFPNLITRARVVFPDSLQNDTILSDALPGANLDTLKSTRTFRVPGKKVINVFVDLKGGTLKEFTYELEILPKQLSVLFDTVPLSCDTIKTGKPDTMKFVASTSPAGGAIDFSVKSQPALDSLHLRVLESSTTALIIATATDDTVYNITVTAKSGIVTKDTTVKLVSRPQITLQEISSVSIMSAGSSDTINFTVNNKAEYGPVNKIILLDTTSFRAGEIVPVVKGTDTLSFIFTPAEIKTYNFSVEVTINGRKDTVSYNISVSGATSPLLLQDTVTIIATEGDSLNLPLISYLADTSVQMSSNKGTVNNKFLTYTVPTVILKDTVIIDINKNDRMSKLRIFLDIHKSNVPKFTVTYIGNGNTGGNVPVDTNSYAAGASVMAANASTLLNAGYTFTGWNTAAGGNGTAHAAGTPYIIGAANDTLFAQWTTNPTYTVTYIGNGNTDGSVPVDENHYEAGASVMAANAATLVKAGYTFTGWNTATAGNGTAHTAGTSYTIGAANDTLYAQWIIKQYTITYIGNGNTSGTVPKDTIPHDYGTAVIVAANSGNLEMPGYIFDGWNTAENGSGISYAAGTDSFEISSDMTLYAKWKIKTFKVTYHGNTNSGGTVPIEEIYDTNAIVIVAANNGNLTKTGFNFIGWSTRADELGISMKAGSKFTINSDMILYAQWKIKQYQLTIAPPSHGTVNISGSIAVDSGASTAITATAATWYSFKNWTVVTGTALIDNPASANTTVKLAQGDAKIQAVFSCTTFKKEIAQPVVSQNVSVAQWDDGSYYLAGQKLDILENGFMQSYPQVNKIDINGNIVWGKTYNNIDAFGSIRKTNDGFILAGNWDNKIKFSKIVPNGNEIISNLFNFSGNGRFALQTDDGNFVVGGTDFERFVPFLFKEDASGNVIWVDSSSFGGADGYRIYDGQQTSESGIVFVGSDMPDNAIVIKKTSTGEESWHKNITDLSGARSIRQTSDGGYITGGNSGVAKCTLIRLNSTGYEMWRSENTNAENIISVSQTSDGGFVYAGSTRIIGEGGYDFYLTRTNSNGTILWTHTFGTAEGNENATGMELTNDGGFVIVGSSGTDSEKLYIVKTDEDGNVDQ